MALPKVLKNFNLFQNGTSWMGQIDSVSLPKLARKMEDYRGGGMDGTVKLDMGAEAMQISFSASGYLLGSLKQFAATSVGAVQLRFAGAVQSDSTGGYDALEVVVFGRYSEIDSGESKPGDRNAWTHTMEVSYYKLSVNGAPVIEIDVINNILSVDGVDVLAAQRAAMGSW